MLSHHSFTIRSNILSILHSWKNLHTEPEIGQTVLYPHRRVQLEFLTIQFGKSLNSGGNCIVYASHRRSDDGRIYVRLTVNAQTVTAYGKFTRMVLQVRLRDADTNESIINYESSSNSTTESAISTVAEKLGKDLLISGMRDNVAQWDWRDRSEEAKYFGASHSFSIEIPVRAVRLVKAEIRLVSQFQNGQGLAKRLIPHRKGMFAKQFFKLEDA